METETVGVIVGIVICTGTVTSVYFSHKSKSDHRIKELEDKVKHHEKFIKILEMSAMQEIEKQFTKQIGDGKQ